MSIPPLDFLLEASLMSLQDLELASLNRSANLSKALRREIEAWIEQEAIALLARWMIENRDVILQGAALTVEVKPKKAEFFEAREVKKTA